MLTNGNNLGALIFLALPYSEIPGPGMNLSGFQSSVTSHASPHSDAPHHFSDYRCYRSLWRVPSRVLSRRCEHFHPRLRLFDSSHAFRPLQTRRLDFDFGKQSGLQDDVFLEDDAHHGQNASLLSEEATVRVDAAALN